MRATKKANNFITITEKGEFLIHILAPTIELLK